MIKKDLLSLLEKSQSPLTVTEILTKIDANKTTIYRQLKSFIKNDLVKQIELGDGKKRYESTKSGHHHHLICMDCKSITEFDLKDDFTKEEDKIKKAKKFKVLEHNLEFFGLCANCK